MKRLEAIGILLLSVTAFVCGCSGGGTASPRPAAGYSVTGIAQAGVIKNGRTQVYGFDSDDNEIQLTETITDENGAYSAQIGTYQGAVVVKVSGSYVDEATGQQITITDSHPLRAALPSGDVNGSVSLAVTPLTEIAVRNAEAAGGIASNAAKANQAVSQIFHVDIVKTLPAAPTVADMTNQQLSGDRKGYAAVLMTLSQYVKDASTGPNPTFEELDNQLSELSSAMQTTPRGETTLLPLVALKIQAAAAAVTTNPATSAIISSYTSSSGDAAGNLLQQLATTGNGSGSHIKSYRITRTEGSGAGTIYGLQLSIGLPDAVTLRTGATTGETLPGVVVTGTAATGAFIVGRYVPGALTVGLVSTKGIGSGDVAVFYVDVPSGAAEPTAGSFTPTVIKAIDNYGNANRCSGIDQLMLLSAVPLRLKAATGEVINVDFPPLVQG